MKRKWKSALFISIVIIILASVLGVFYAVIMNTPNLNANIKFKATEVLGIVDAKIKNAGNGSPSKYFSFDYTEAGEDILNWKANNLLFKSDTESIIVEFSIKNMSHFKVLVIIEFETPHKNAKVIGLIDGLEAKVNRIVMNAESDIVVQLAISKLKIKEPIRANLNLSLNLLPYAI